MPVDLPEPRFRRTTRCPRCGGASIYAPENAYRPFCGQSCKQADWAAWATEQYRVADTSGDASSDADDAVGGMSVN